MDKKYTYDAFISYRHTELDKFVAENLHRAMETFKPPKSILKAGRTSRTRIERVFRDRDELPLASNLEDPIVSALKQSEYLIVICSPRLKESMWCKREIETFIEFHGRENVLAVLVEGEPEESFPEELLFIEEEVTRSDGTKEIRKRSVEPLAADVRGGNKKEILKAMKSELLRLLAPMFAVSYDDLRQRHRERRMKRIVATSVAASVVCLLIGVGSTVAALQIKRQKEQIEKQAGEISAQAEEIKAQNDRLLVNQAKNLSEKALGMLEEGDRMGAIQTAGQALGEYDGLAMPYTPEAKYALTESLHIYDSGGMQKAQYQLAASGVIDFICVSPDRKTVIAFDSAQQLCIWDVASGKLIDSINDIDTLFTEKQVTYIDSDRFAYWSNEGLVHIYQISRQKVTDTISADGASSLSSDPEGKYLAVCGWGRYQIYDMASLQPLYTFETENKQGLNARCFFSDENSMIYTETLQGAAGEAAGGDSGTDSGAGEAAGGDSGTDSGAEDAGGANQERTRLFYVNMTDGTVYATQVIPYNYVSDIYFAGQRAYVVADDILSGQKGRRSAVIAYNLTDGTAVWEYILQDKKLDGIEAPYLEEAKNLMAYAFGEVYLLDKETGKEIDRISVGDGIVGSGVFKDTGDFMVYTRGGNFIKIFQDGSEHLVLNYIFESKSQNVKTFKTADGCFLVLPYNENRITVYSVSKNPDIRPYEGEPVPEGDARTEGTVTEEGMGSIEEAEKLGLERAALVSRILYSQDGTAIFVSYSDSTLEIYNAADMVLLETIKDLKCDMTRYLGVDTEGNTYIAGLSYGYCLDSSYRLTARIERLLKVDSANSQLIVGSDDAMSVIPIYTTEALLGQIPEEIR